MLRLAAGDANVLSGRNLSVEEVLKGALSKRLAKRSQFRHLELLARPRKIIPKVIHFAVPSPEALSSDATVWVQGRFEGSLVRSVPTGDKSS